MPYETYMRIPTMNSSTASGIMSSPATAKSVSKKPVKKSEEVAAPVAAPAPVVTPEAKKPKKEKAAVVAEPAPVVPVVVTAAPVETTEAAVVSVQDDVKAMLTQASTVRETVGALVSELKRLEKRVAKLQKEADKRRRKSKKPVEGEPVKERKPSIFEIPTPLSPELCSFLGVSNGSKESRSNVTKAVTAYVKKYDLKNKHTIVPDSKLKSLLGVSDSDVLTYFNLQRYLNRHYLKATPAATA